jgi:hypothetical protein
LTFLAPIPAIIAAALTVPVLVAYYLLKLRRRPVRISSTLLWLQAVRDVQVNVPFRWLRPTWLFFLQLAVLALLLGALARPAIDAPSTMPTRVILLIDRTASMGAVETPGGLSRLELAKREAIRTLDDLGRASVGDAGAATEDQMLDSWPRRPGIGSRRPLAVAVIAFGTEPVALTPSTSDRRRVRGIIESITVSDQPGETGPQQEGATGRGLQGALDLAGAMLAGDVEELGPREHGMVILFSDGVAATRQSYSLPGDFRYVRIGDSEPPDNLGIVALSARRDWDDPSAVRIFARLVNAGPEAVAAGLALLVDGEEVQRTAAEIPGPEENGRAGESAATFRVEMREGGVATVRLLRDDALTADNEASIVIDPARRARVIVVTPDRPEAAPGAEPQQRGPEWFITTVVREMRLPMRIMPQAAYESLPSLGADLVIFDRVTPRRIPPVPTLSFGAGLPLEGLRISEPAEDRRSYILSWQRTHPILRHVALDTITIARPLQLAVESTHTQGPRLHAEELARGTHGPLMLLLDDRGLPRLIVGFELLQSNWPVHQGFPIFLASAIDHLTLRDQNAGRAFTTAEPAVIAVPANLSRIVLDGPRRITADVPPRGVEAGQRRINLGLIDRAGVYRFAGALDQDGPAAIAVNLASQTETALRGRDAIRVGGEMHTARAGSAGPREIWHWFVLAAFGLLCVEWLVNVRRMRV